METHRRNLSPKMNTFSQTKYCLCTDILTWFVAQDHFIRFTVELDVLFWTKWVWRVLPSQFFFKLPRFYQKWIFFARRRSLGTLNMQFILNIWVCAWFLLPKFLKVLRIAIVTNLRRRWWKEPIIIVEIDSADRRTNETNRFRRRY